MSFGALVHALQHGKVLKAHQLVYLRLADHATDSGLSWPSHSLLARESGYTREYVIRVMHDLLTEGVIKEVFDAKGRRRYQLHVYDFKAKQCSCEQPPDECELSSQALKSNGELSSAGVNSAACKSSHDNENAVEPGEDEPEKTCAHAHETSTADDHRCSELGVEPRPEPRIWENDADMQEVRALVAKFLKTNQSARDVEHPQHSRGCLSRGAQWVAASMQQQRQLDERLTFLRNQARILAQEERRQASDTEASFDQRRATA